MHTSHTLSPVCTVRRLLRRAVRSTGASLAVPAVALAVPLIFPLGGQAAAACIDQVQQLEERRDVIEKMQEPKEESQIQESWSATPNSLKGVSDLLSNARDLHSDGEEDGCLTTAEQAARILDALHENAE